MPHLSPMNWILMMLLMWLSSSVLMASMWWNKSYTFSMKNTKNKSSSSKLSWKW